MNGVIGMTGLLLDTTLTPEQREYARTVRASAEALLTVINDILDFSKVEAGRLDIETVDFNLAVIAEEAVDLLAETASAKGIELAYLVDDDVPAFVGGDPGRLRQVVLNLLSNAVKFTGRGEVTMHLSLAASDEASALVRLEVTDTGIGIPLEAQSRLFQPFSQVDASTTRKYGGTGLGLAISKRLVDLMGGEIGLRSEPGRGSTFWFTTRVQRRPEPGPPVALADVAGLRVLVAASHPFTRLLIARTVQRLGGSADQVSSATAVVNAIRQASDEDRPYGLVFLDEDLSKGYDLALLGTLAGGSGLAAVPVVLLTASRTTTRVVESLLAARLPKPVRASHIVRALTTIFGESRRPATSQTPEGGQPESAHKGRILLAEDNAVNQKVATRLLEKLGYRVDVAGNGREAVEALGRIRYDLVLMDCQMPEMDGYEATAQIRSAEYPQRRTPIIAMTAGAMPGDRERCLESGMDDYLTKPVDVEKLRRALARWLPAQVA
jgi:CheY-like chemotaxis protein/anti-sigma regulatory factor (Ser/Thr protein kinase)